MIPANVACPWIFFNGLFLHFIYYSKGNRMFKMCWCTYSDCLVNHLCNYTSIKAGQMQNEGLAVSVSRSSVFNRYSMFNLAIGVFLLLFSPLRPQHLWPFFPISHSFLPPLCHPNSHLLKSCISLYSVLYYIHIQSLGLPVLILVPLVLEVKVLILILIWNSSLKPNSYKMTQMLLTIKSSQCNRSKNNACKERINCSSNVMDIINFLSVVNCKNKKKNSENQTIKIILVQAGKIYSSTLKDIPSQAHSEKSLTLICIRPCESK